MNVGSWRNSRTWRAKKEMPAARIGGTRVHNAPVRLIAYSADWPALFVREA